MSTASRHLPPDQRNTSSGLRVPSGDRPAGRPGGDSRQPLLDRSVSASSGPVSVMGPPNRAPGIGAMGGPDRSGPLDVMGGPDRGHRVNAMGGPDRGHRVDVMGESYPGVVDSLFTGQTKGIGPR